MMDTQPENDVPETPEATPAESTEKLSPQGIAAMQGDNAAASTDTIPDATPDPAAAPADLNPPPEANPQTSDGTELGSAKKIETGVERYEKKEFTYKDNEIGGLHHRPSGPEGGG